MLPERPRGAPPIATVVPLFTCALEQRGSLTVGLMLARGLGLGPEP